MVAGSETCCSPRQPARGDHRGGRRPGRHRRRDSRQGRRHHPPSLHFAPRRGGLPGLRPARPRRSGPRHHLPGPASGPAQGSLPGDLESPPGSSLRLASASRSTLPGTCGVPLPSQGCLVPLRRLCRRRSRGRRRLRLSGGRPGSRAHSLVLRGTGGQRHRPRCGPDPTPSRPLPLPCRHTAGTGQGPDDSFPTILSCLRRREPSGRPSVTRTG